MQQAPATCTRGATWRMVTALAAVLSPAPASAQVRIVIPPDAVCGECRVTLRPVVTLGDADGPGMLESEYSHARRDSRGRYYVWASGSPYFWVFGADGRVIRRVGARGGGPGEFRSVSGILIGTADSTYAFDESERRLSVFSPEYALVRTARLDLDTGFRSVFLGGGIVVNSMVRTAERIGYPLHLLDLEGRILRSFGSTSGAYRPDMRDALEVRELSADGSRVWSSWINQYVVERWDTTGNLDLVLERNVDWFSAWWRPEGGLKEPPLPVTTAIQVRNDTMWVLVRVPGREWRTAVQPRGRSYTITAANVYQHTMVEVIDLVAERVVASSEVPLVLFGFAGPGLVFGSTSDRTGNPVVPVWRLETTTSGEKGRTQ